MVALLLLGFRQYWVRSFSFKEPSDTEIDSSGHCLLSGFRGVRSEVKYSSEINESSRFNDVSRSRQTVKSKGELIASSAITYMMYRVVQKNKSS